MLAKCANPPCFASFRRLEWGTLFRLENDRIASQSRLATTEYYWLCPNCSQEMTLRIERKNGVKVVRLRGKAPCESESPRFVPLDRHDRLLLNGIRFAGPRIHAIGESRKKEESNYE